MITKEDRAQELGICHYCHHDLDSDEYLENRELIDNDEFWDRERAWLFYESGVQDMRENKSLIWVYKFLGRFDDIRDAEKAYIKAAKEYFGEFYFDNDLNFGGEF